MISRLSFHFVLFFSLCSVLSAEEPDSDQSEEKKSGGHSMVTLFLVLVCIVIAAAILFIGYKIWLKRKREEQQARFIKLFEDDEDLEAELGLRD
jgi:heme/copper-type cytochrome/quinol oxidase subunit 2